MSSGISRREMLSGAAALSALAPGRVLGANDRINFGCIGVGGMGTGHLSNLVKRAEEDNLRVVAVCDVYQKRVTRAVKMSNAAPYTDYRRLLENKEVDAVLIATPDHWHAKISIDAIEAGKHVYCEKPMTHTVGQALAVRDTVRRHKQVFQVGVQGTGNDLVWQARDAIHSGRIGKVTWAQGSYNRNSRICAFNGVSYTIDPAAGPGANGEDHIDWDMWLGHQFGLAQKIPYNPEHYFRFRKYWAYSGGVATDLLYHKLAPLLLSISGPNGEYPHRVNASGGLYVEKDGRDIPDVFMMTVDYSSEFSVFLVSALTNDATLPDRIYGKEGTLEIGKELQLRANGEFFPEFRQKNAGSTETHFTPEPRPDHKGNFMDAIRGKGTVNCNAELGAATMVAIKLAVESYRQNKTMLWDVKNERITV